MGESEAAADFPLAWQTFESCWAFLKGHLNHQGICIYWAGEWPLWELEGVRKMGTWLPAVAISSDSCVWILEVDALKTW